MAKQLEFEVVGERSELGKACIEYLNLLDKKENLEKEVSSAKEAVIEKMKGEGRTAIKIENYQIKLNHRETDALTIKIKEKE